MFIISKEFKFDAGHRVYTQQLNEVLACDNLCACKHLHGHEYKVEVYLEANSTNQQGMVTDFKHLNWFKQWLDEVFDHKFIFGVDDPFANYFLDTLFKHGYKINICSYMPLSNSVVVSVSINSYDKIHEYIRKNKFGVIYLPESQIDTMEFLLDVFDDGIVLVDFIPTAENLAKFFYEVIENEMISNLDYNPDGIQISKVIVWETSKSKAVFVKEVG